MSTGRNTDAIRADIAAQIARLSERELAIVYRSLCKRGAGDTARVLAYKKPLWIAKRIETAELFEETEIGRFRAALRELRKSERELLKREIKRSFRNWRRYHPDGKPDGEPEHRLEAHGAQWRIYRAEPGRRGFALERNGKYVHGPDTVKRCRERAVMFVLRDSRANEHDAFCF